MNTGGDDVKATNLKHWLERGYCSVGYDVKEPPAGTEPETRRTLLPKYSQEAVDNICRLVFGVRQDDWLVVAGPETLHLGVFAGEYEFIEASAEAGDPHRHRRAVRWVDAVERTKELRKVSPRQAISRIQSLANRAAVIEAFGLDVGATAPLVAYVPDSMNITAYPVFHDGEALAAAHNLHNTVRNELADLALGLGLSPRERTAGEPEADLYIDRDDDLTVVCEVKSVDGGNDSQQLRLGLGQILDYRSQLRERPRYVAVLWVSQRPADADRWTALCAESDVVLGWPGREHVLVHAAPAVSRLPVRATYDGVANAGYVYLTLDEHPRSARMYACDPIEVGGMINLDFDAEDRLIGVEVLDARARLPLPLLDAAERLDVADPA